MREQCTIHSYSVLNDLHEITPGGLNKKKNVLHRPRYLNPWFPVVGVVWGVGAVLLEKVHHWGQL